MHAHVSASTKQMILLMSPHGDGDPPGRTSCMDQKQHARCLLHDDAWAPHAEPMHSTMSQTSDSRHRCFGGMAGCCGGAMTWSAACIARCMGSAPLVEELQALGMRRGRDDGGGAEGALDVVLSHAHRVRVGAAAGVAQLVVRKAHLGQRRRVREALQHRVHEARVAQVLQPRSLRHVMDGGADGISVGGRRRRDTRREHRERAAAGVDAPLCEQCAT